jgi:hypothetical protein
MRLGGIEALVYSSNFYERVTIVCARAYETKGRIVFSLARAEKCLVSARSVVTITYAVTNHHMMRRHYLTRASATV